MRILPARHANNGRECSSSQCSYGKENGNQEDSVSQEKRRNIEKCGKKARDAEPLAVLYLPIHSRLHESAGHNSTPEKNQSHAGNTPVQSQSVLNIRGNPESNR